ncbi:MAG TPA: DUF6691 family protein [Xanthobacteraceae bacterium]|nr:DUF6691 family protein [Xanthobacteraceae bacterium]
MMRTLIAFGCGLVFGFGLLISGMTQPAKVLGFLDVFGAWDPSLAVVMAAALAVSCVGFALARRRGQPLCGTQSFWPTATRIDRPLAVGAVLFGAGWGMVGLCPGPALENLATASPRVLVFVAAMALGVLGQNLWQRRRSAGEAPALATLVDG